MNQLLLFQIDRMMANLIKPSGTLNDIERDTNIVVSLISIANPRDNNSIVGGFLQKYIRRKQIEPKHSCRSPNDTVCLLVLLGYYLSFPGAIQSTPASWRSPGNYDLTPRND